MKKYLPELALFAVIAFVCFIVWMRFSAEKEENLKYPFFIKSNSIEWRASEILAADESGCVFIANDGKEVLIKGDYIIIQLNKK